MLVLGAGASVAEALAHRPRRDGDHPPLDGNFFARAARRARRDGSSSTGRADLLRRIVLRAEELGQPDISGASPSVSLEEHLGRLFYELNTAASVRNIESYYDLVRLYNNELLDTTNWMVGRSGMIKRLIQRELTTYGRVSVVTFNHDLLIENALATIPSSRYGNVWCFRHCYGLPETMRRISNATPRFEVDCPGAPDRHVPVFKMHGSCNWVYRTRNAYPSSQVARGNRELLLWDNKEIASSATKVGAAAGRRPWYMWPLIVPPVYEKHSYIRGELKQVWDGAAAALEDATRVVFWGYSFPRADLHARYFFRGLAQRNPALRAPLLINPDPHVQDELWAVLQPAMVAHYRDINAFLSV